MASREFNYEQVRPSTASGADFGNTAANFAGRVGDFATNIMDVATKIQDRRSELLTNAALQEALATGKMPTGLSDEVDSGALMEGLYKSSLARQASANADKLEYETSDEFLKYQKQVQEQELANQRASVAAQEAQTSYYQSRAAAERAAIEKDDANAQQWLGIMTEYDAARNQRVNEFQANTQDRVSRSTFGGASWAELDPIQQNMVAPIISKEVSAFKNQEEFADMKRVAIDPRGSGNPYKADWVKGTSGIFNSAFGSGGGSGRGGASGLLTGGGNPTNALYAQDPGAAGEIDVTNKRNRSIAEIINSGPQAIGQNVLPDKESGTWRVVGNPNDIQRTDYKDDKEDYKRFRNDLEKEEGEGGFELNLDVSDHTWEIFNKLGMSTGINRDRELFDLYRGIFGQNKELFKDFIENRLLKPETWGDREFTGAGKSAGGVKVLAKDYLNDVRGYIQENVPSIPQNTTFWDAINRDIATELGGLY